MAAQLTFEELFDADFLTALERLALEARQVFRDGRRAEQRSRHRGAGVEFADYKPYTPGDDLRAIDWNIYRRLSRLFVRVFEEYQDLPVYMLVDRSESMYFETPPRIDAGLRTAFGLAHIALGQHDSVGLYSFSAELEIHVRRTSGKNQLMRFGRQLAALDRRSGTRLAAALQRLASVPLRRGLLVAISDFFDPSGIDEVIDALSLSRHKLLLVQLATRADAEPTLNEALHGDVRLRDCESGEAVDVTVEPAVVARYKDIYRQFNERLSRFANERGAGLLRLDADGDVLEQLAGLFASGRLTV